MQDMDHKTQSQKHKSLFYASGFILVSYSLTRNNVNCYCRNQHLGSFKPVDRSNNNQSRLCNSNQGWRGETSW